MSQIRDGIKERLAMIRQQLDELRGDEELLAEALGILTADERKLIGEVKPKPVSERLLDNLGQGWLTIEQLARKTGIHPSTAYKHLSRFAADGVHVDSQKINGVIHYRRKRKELRVVAGEGVVAA